jgi:hypothetical protein
MIIYDYIQLYYRIRISAIYYVFYSNWIQLSPGETVELVLIQFWGYIMLNTETVH